MGLFAQAGTAMPLPPAQAEAIYDLSLDEERTDNRVDAMLADESTDEVSAAIRKSSLVMVTSAQEARRDREPQTVPGGNPELPSNGGHTKP